MESMEQSYAPLAQLLQRTLGADRADREAAEQQLRQAEKQPGVLLLFLRLSTMEAVPKDIRLCAAVFFKNSVKSQWEDSSLIGPNRQLIKQALPGLMIDSPPMVEAVLAEAIAHIAKFDFFQQWPTLLPDMLNILKTKGIAQTPRVLRVLNSIFERYRWEPASDPLWNEIKYVLEQLQAPLLEIFKAMVGAIPAEQQNKDKIRAIFASLKEICTTFYLLNVQTIPEFFEDHMQEWMEPLCMLLSYNNPLLAPDDPSEPGLLEQVKAIVCECAELYTDQYEEEFNRFVGPFVQVAWNLVTTLGEQARYDIVVTAAVKFLTTVVSKEWHKNLFENEASLRMMCEKVIIPQLKLRDADQEMFHENGLEYIRRDVEGSDIDTRRRTTVDFVRGLCTHFEQQVTAILKQYVGVLLQQYAAAPAQNWLAKDAAMYIILSLAVQGSTQLKGVTRVNQYVDINDFLVSQVLPELQKDVNVLPILKADCLKFVSTFRAQLPKEAFPQILPLLVRHLASRQFVVHTYAAAAIDRLLMVKDDKTNRISKDIIAKELPQLTAALFETLKHPDSHENDYVVRAILRVCSVSEELMAPLAGVVIQHVAANIKRVARSPTNPRFNHYLFEVLSCLIKFICKVNPDNVAHFENALFPTLVEILQDESSSDFHPYVFQIFAQMLFLHKQTPKAYDDLWPQLMLPMRWLSHGNVPALVGLVQVYIRLGGDAVLNKIQPVLGVFQQLLAIPKLDHFATQLLNCIFQSLPQHALAQYVQEIFRLLLLRLQRSSTPKFTKNFIAVASVFELKFGFAALHKLMDAMQPGLLAMVMEKVWAVNVNTVSSDDRKVVACAMTNMLCSAEMMNPPFSNIWAKWLEAIVQLFEGKEENVDDEEHDLLDFAEQDSSTSYAPLAFADIPELNPVANLPDATVVLATSLAKLSEQMPQRLGPLIQTIKPELGKALEGYFQAANVQLH